MTGEFAVRRERLLARTRGRVLEFDERAVTDASLKKASFDTVVLVHTLCRMEDADVAVRRIDELLAPGGQILVLEHVRSPGLRGHLQDGTTMWWRHMPGGCHVNGDPIAVLRRNGFAVTDCDRFRQRTVPMVAAHISAVAVRKAKPITEETDT